MSDNRNDIVRDQKPGKTKLTVSSVASTVPAHFQTEYPDFINFLEQYFEWINSTDGFGDLLTKLSDIRDIDITEAEYAAIMSNEFGNSFPNLGGLDDSLALKIFKFWHKSKGTKQAIEKYFSTFLNAEAEVIYPKDNMFIVDGGNWNDAETRYNNSQSHIDETTSVLQDDFFYQIYSYLVKSDVSLVDWADVFKEIAHPAGWVFFGEVEITSEALFEYLTYSPTRVPGFQVKDSDILILGAAAFAMGASAQTIVKTWRLLSEEASPNTYSFADVNNNFFYSTYTIGSFDDIAIGTFGAVGYPDPSETLTNRQRPARIVITTV